MAERPKNELPFALPLTDVAQEIYLYFRDDLDVVRDVSGKSSSPSETADEERKIIFDIKNYLYLGDYLRQKDSALTTRGIMGWLEDEASYYRPQAIARSVARAIAVDNEEFTSFGLNDSASRFILDLLLRKFLDELSCSIETSKAADEFGLGGTLELPFLISAENAQVEKLKAFRERVAPAGPSSEQR